MSEKNKKIGSILGLSVIFSIVAGGLAGIIATINTNQSLDAYSRSLQEDQRFVTISEVKPRPLPGTYEEALSRVRETAWVGVAGVRVISQDTASPALWLQDDSMLGAGAVLTSDGWIAFHRASFNTFTDPVGEAEIWIDGDRYLIEDFVEDSLSELVMVKVEARNLISLAFGASENMNSGDLLFALRSDQEVFVESITNSREGLAGVINQAETFSVGWQLDSETEAGVPLFNSLAEFVGFTTIGSEALPLHQALPFVRATIRDGEGSRAALGARVVDIASTLNIDETVTGGVTSGALVVSDKTLQAVAPGSPAELAGILSGDIIVSIDGNMIDETATLAEIIAGFEVGDTATLVLQRAGEDLDLEITFAEFSDLRY